MWLATPDSARREKIISTSFSLQRSGINSPQRTSASSEHGCKRLGTEKGTGYFTAFKSRSKGSLSAFLPLFFPLATVAAATRLALAPELLKTLIAPARVSVELIAERVFLVKILVVLLRRVELGRRSDLGDDGLLKGLGVLQHLF